MGGITRTVVVAGALAMALAGCWVQPGSDSRRSGFSSLEQGITPANVSQLHEVWTKQLDAAVKPPAVTLDGIYTTTGNFIVGGKATLVARNDGTTRWSKTLWPDGSPYSVEPPTVLGSTVYVPIRSASTALNSSIQRFDAATGTPAGNFARSAGPLIGHGTVLAGTSAMAMPGVAVTRLFVEDTAGAGSWESLLYVGGVTGASEPTSPAVGAGRVFIGNGLVIEAYTVTKPTNCTVTFGYSFCEPIWSTSTTTPVAGHPVLSADDATVFAAAGTKLVTLNAATGTPGWTGTLGATASKAPAIGNGFVYVPTSTGELDVFAEGGCGQATCAPLWTATTGSAITQPPAVVPGGLVYTASADGTLRAYNAAGCPTSPCPSRWSATTGSAITGGPVPGLGQIYIGTEDGRLIAYGL